VRLGAQGVDRRAMLKLGGAAALAMLATGAPRALGLGFPSAERIFVVADPRYAESRSFASSLERCGASVLSLASRMDRLWFDAIAPRLDGSLQAVAGLTLHSELFVLERLAETRPCYVGMHDWRCRNDSRHELAGALDLKGVAAALSSDEREWASPLGPALVAAAPREFEQRRIVLSRRVAAADGPRFFVSWVLAPRPRSPL
jgi:hypothetical protein